MPQTRFFRPRFSFAALAAVAMTGLLFSAGCKKNAGSGPPKEVRIGYFANVTHAQAVLGVASGDFEKALAPSKLSTKVFNAGPSLIEALFNGEIDIGYVGPGPALTGFAMSKGKGLRVVSGSAGNGVLIVARKDSDIHSLQDLAGKKLATPQHGNTQDVSARHYLTDELKQKDASNIAPIANAEQAGLMDNGQIDASSAPEPWGSYLVAKTDARVIAEEKDLWPEGNFGITVVVTTPEFLKDHPDVVEKVLGVHLTWTDRLRNEPDAYLPQLEQALFALTNKKLPPGVLKSAVGHTTFSEEPLGHTFVKFAQWTTDLGFSRDPIDPSGLVDDAIVRKLRAAAPRRSRRRNRPPVRRPRRRRRDRDNDGASKQGGRFALGVNRQTCIVRREPSSRGEFYDPRDLGTGRCPLPEIPRRCRSSG